MALGMSVQYDDRKVLAKLKNMEVKAAKKAVRKGVRAGRKNTLAMARSKNHAHIIEWATAMGCPAN